MTDIKRVYRLSFNKAAKTYEDQAAIQRHTARLIAQKVKNAGGLGLDCGCGTCFISDFLPGKHIINLDISKAMARVCRNKGYPVVVGDIEMMPFKDGCFDYVVSNFTLHWTDLSKSFSQINRVLKDGGVFVFSIPVRGSLKAIEQITGRSFFDFEDTEKILGRLETHFCVEHTSVSDFVQEMEDGMAFLRHLHLTGSMVNQKDVSIREKLNIVRAFGNHRGPVELNFRVALFECRKSNPRF